MHNSKLILITVMLVLGLSACAITPELPPVKNAPKQIPKASVRIPDRAVVALVLGGGAARGFAHVGVLKVLEDNHIPVDIVVGTSAGSVVGALYAGGVRGESLVSAAEQLELGNLTDWVFPDRGVIKGEKLQIYVNDLLNDTPIEKLPIRFVAVATDLLNGQLVAFNQGNTGMAVRASSAIPGLVQPVNIAGRDYVDGGIVSQVPVIVAKKMGANVVIAVDVSQVLLNQSELNSTLAVMLQSNLIMSHKMTAREINQAHVIIRPVINGIKMNDFDLRDQALMAGEKATQAVLPTIRHVIDAVNKSKQRN